jgi:methionyl-tRNA formyltransferase
MGTPDFAVPSLDILVKNNYRVVGVITAPDKPAGRGLLPQMSAVKKYALENNLLLLQPEKLKSPEFQNELKNLKPDLQVVVAFRMLPESVWSPPQLGTFNLHASLLPQYRGAAPINWSIINGEKETGVTTFFLEKEIDTGNILFQKKISINSEMTAGDLHDSLMLSGAELVLQTVKAIEQKTIHPQKQIANKELKTAPKIFTETCKINWNYPTENIYNLIRGLSPYPCAFSFLNDKKLKVYFGEKEIISHSEIAGTISSDNKTFLKFATADGFIKLTDLQLEGKKRMGVEEFLRGFKVK